MEGTVMTTKDIIREWLHEGLAKGATHVIVAVDTFDYTDYPVFVMPGEDAREQARGLGQMQSLMEVYSLALDIEAQLAESKAMHYEPVDLVRAATVVEKLKERS